MLEIDLKQLPPIHHTLGGHAITWDAQQQHLYINYLGKPEFCNPRGSIEGGMLCAMLDDAMGLFAYYANGQKAATTIHLSLDFLRPCAVGVVEVRCYFIKQGRQILNIEAVATQQDKLIAKMVANFMVLA
jgi:uncharacterized protein (TIGR00369 family)